MAEQESLQVLSGHRCEGCGYSLDGHTRNEVCPECDLETALSLPRERAGTPWQQRAGLRSLLQTWWLLLVDDACWREMRIDRKSRRKFVGWVRLVVYLFLSLAVVWQVLMVSGGHFKSAEWTYFILVMVAFMFVVEVSMRAYRAFVSWRLEIGTMLRDETQGQAAHDQVLDHACVGMLIMPIFMALGVACINIGILAEHATESMTWIQIGFWSGGILGFIGLMLGCTAFEMSYRRGWRVMRYRKLVLTEYEQVSHDDFEDAMTSGIFLLDLLEIGTLQKLWSQDPTRAIAVGCKLVLKYIITPAIFLILWLVYGQNIGLSAFASFVSYVVLSILLRLLMVPLCLLVGNSASTP